MTMLSCYIFWDILGSSISRNVHIALSSCLQTFSKIYNINYTKLFFHRY